MQLKLLDNDMKTYWTLKRACFAVAALVLALTAPTIHAQSFAIDWYKISGGGGTSTGATYQVTGTIGQADAGGAMTGGSYTLTGGFWSLISVVQTPGMPTLTITHAGGSVIVSWPSTGSYTLQQNTEAATTNWGPSGYTVITADGTSSATFTPGPGRLFFRLKQ
jgi:hypothetical protein